MCFVRAGGDLARDRCARRALEAGREHAREMLPLRLLARGCERRAAVREGIKLPQSHPGAAGVLVCQPLGSEAELKTVDAVRRLRARGACFDARRSVAQRRERRARVRAGGGNIRRGGRVGEVARTRLQARNEPASRARGCC
mmetsp:Transcript_9509/g.25372  ORF Transcript_9509/g.25372 Transcript_9509/m.25372 type:complete len:142 (+) Transcript_9509:91-516(+)